MYVHGYILVMLACSYEYDGEPIRIAKRQKRPCKTNTLIWGRRNRNCCYKMHSDRSRSGMSPLRFNIPLSPSMARNRRLHFRTSGQKVRLLLVATFVFVSGSRFHKCWANNSDVEPYAQLGNMHSKLRGGAWVSVDSQPFVSAISTTTVRTVHALS